ncbi:MAG: hypothetical protein HKO65_04640 [Gemmatimonadetes bacterium]|nr:hypothetical protein [Gemmatimonadota bacterium]NNM04368.1 hypothetical protein [Gemmatimonadota bacterium]
MTTKIGRSVSPALFSFAAVVGLWLLFNLVAMPIAWGGVNATEGTLGLIQTIILMGFVLIVLFDFLSLGWVSFRGKTILGPGASGGIVALGIGALTAMMAAKVMVDEIARETPLGRAGGEWGILYACMILQLSYILVVLFRTKPSSG